jgi:hypothetical protein
MNGYSVYRSTRPKIVEKVVEKPVDRIVEKVVSAHCPESSKPDKLSPKTQSPAADAPASPPAPLIPPGTTITATASGPNGIAVGVNTGTINPSSPPSKIEGFRFIPSAMKEDGGHPITTFTFYLSEAVIDQEFEAICDRPCSALGANSTSRETSKAPIFGGDVLTGQDKSSPVAAWIINYPIHAEEYQVFTVVSEDSNPVNVTHFTFGKFSIKPQ